MDAQELLKAGRVADALKQLTVDVKARPTDAKLRVFLFQLLVITGNWERALTALNVAADLDPANLLMAQVCRQALACEALRKEIFLTGTKLPLVLGQPAEWLGWLIQANQLTAQGQHAEGQALRAKAFDAAPASAGMLNGTPFEWIADADQRLGPVLEAIVDGKYYWVPFTNIASVEIEKPADLRDVAWLPARFTWVNGGQAVALIPARYPGTEASTDGQLLLGRKTDWVESPGGLTTGLGQRLLATDSIEVSLLEVRTIQLAAPASAAVGAPAADTPAGAGGTAEA